ncbi:hypothetical protein FM105_04790 [Brevibacterium yomogidense]|uniref:Uncharacterized protein n=1 Tax=Brevibacterium yomogidense TaxID=946573 RepID=A0A1X6X870_9MICO|nr:hypothetical protein FM105_04790 [Brevibacterium yomogidense]
MDARIYRREKTSSRSGFSERLHGPARTRLHETNGPHKHD